MGNRQENWFYEQLSYSQERKAAWRVIGQQIVFSRLNESLLYGDALPFDFVCSLKTNLT
jgi:alkaline phosphatase D